jgi:ubiquinol-cytochrome c reductase cytochrome b subunit
MLPVFKHFKAQLSLQLSKYRWGSWSLICLYISIASGIVVGLQYDLTTPYYSVTALDLLVPYGEFFRSVHFYSSQIFFLFGCVHFIAVFNKTDSYSQYDWAALIMALVVALLLLFTGYVLRDDNTGFSAGMIAEAILKNIPLVGNTINNVLFAISEHGMKRVYVHHVITLDVFWLILSWDHLRRYRVKVTDHIPLICLTLGFCLIIAAPLEPESLGITYISGPWFFLGLQELLRYFHPLFAGVIFPATFLVALLYARNQNRHFRKILWFLYVWLLAYAILSAVAWLR